MQRSSHMFQATTTVILVCFMQMLALPTASLAQAPDCPYDRANPSLEHARISFKSLNYECAEQEIQDFLKLEKLTIQERADAHVLMAAVYYAKLEGDKEKRGQVVEQFKKAFQAYRDWRGELDISSSEFIEMMNQARTELDKEAAATPPATTTQPPVTGEQPVVTPPPVQKVETPKKEGEKKAWYTKWWAIGLGVGVVALAVVALGGGGGDGDGGQPQTALPDPPPPPPGK
jgi:hypothetical protein